MNQETNQGPPAVGVSIATEATEELLHAFARLMPQLSTSAVPLSAHELTRILTSPTSTILVARDEDTIVGTLTLVTFRIPTGFRAWIEDVVVDSSARRRGVGEALTREAVRLATTLGAKTIDLTSRHSRAAAHQLYEKCGFAVRESNVYRYVVPTRRKTDASAKQF